MSDEMVEKARAAAEEYMRAKGSRNCDVFSALDLLASFARSAVRDALGELEPNLDHAKSCNLRKPFAARISPADDCTCGLSALRKKFEAE